MKFSRPFLLAACVAALAAAPVLQAQPRASRGGVPLGQAYFKDGAHTLAAFRSISDTVRDSVVQVMVNGKWIALGTVVSAEGLVLTKASEIVPGRLMCRTAAGKEFLATVLATDDDTDLALLQLPTRELKPIQWLQVDTKLGQWIAVPGIAAVPEAVGIVSVTTRKILPRRAYLGIELPRDMEAAPVVTVITAGLGAARAGLQVGDLFLDVTGKKVSTVAQLRDILAELREGQTVDLTMRRDAKEFKVAIPLSSLETLNAALAAADGRGRGGSANNRADRMNKMGTGVSTRAEDFELAIQHDSVLEPYQCGGPLVDLDGKAVGINIARAGRVASYALPASLVIAALERMRTNPKL